MKTEQRTKARALRMNGIAMGEIAKKLKVAKSSVSYWVRDVQLTSQQRKKLNSNGHSIDAIEKRRISRLKGTEERRHRIRQNAMKEVLALMKDPLWSVGVALYWGEGGKTQQTARLSNSDPSVIRLMMRFFHKYAKVSPEKYHGHVHTHSNENAPQAVCYWSKVSGIPEEKFYRTYVKKSNASKNKRQTLPYGTMQIYIHDTNFFFRIMGWIKGIEEYLV